MKALQPRPLAAAIASVFGCIIVAVPATAKDDDGDKDRFSARLSGYNEVHFNAGPPATLRGAISTKATGSFSARIDDGLQQLTYELSYRDLEGTVTQAHIHFGQHHTVGGITVWLCQTSTNPSPSASTPTCPGPSAGTVTGTITSKEVLAPAGQGIDAGSFDELVRAIRAGATYANVHSSVYGPGEIRGQVVGNRGRGKGHGGHGGH